MALRKELFDYQKKKYGKASHKHVGQPLSVITYADDCVILHENEEIVFKAKNLTERWLNTIGLEFKPSKTKISHTLKTYGR